MVTAPPSPPAGTARCSTETASLENFAASAMAAGVSSVLSSTKMTSAGTPAGIAPASLASSSAMFAASLKVGMTSVICGAVGPTRSSRDSTPVNDVVT